MARGRHSSSDDWLWSYLDIALLSFFTICSFALVAIASINPPAHANPDSAKPPGDIMVCISWQGFEDIDLWGTAPGQKVATGYANKNGETLDLVRDDLGKDALTRQRSECQFARGLPDGRWAFNAHGYSVPDAEVMVHAEIRLGGDDGFKLLAERDLAIKQEQERTIVQFELRGGQVVPGSVNQVYVPLRSAHK